MRNVAILIVTLFFFSHEAAFADSDGRITFGDVNAAFNTFSPAMINVIQNEHAAPVVGGTRGRGRLLPVGEILPHCANDWIMVNLYAFADAAVQTRQEAFELINSGELLFLIDGVAYDSVRTPIRFARTENDLGERVELWYANDGFFIQPGALSVGIHDVLVVLFDEDLCPPEGCGFGDGTDGFEPWEFEILADSDPQCLTR